MSVTYTRWPLPSHVTDPDAFRVLAHATTLKDLHHVTERDRERLPPQRYMKVPVNLLLLMQVGSNIAVKSAIVLGGKDSAYASKHVLGDADAFYDFTVDHLGPGDEVNLKVGGAIIATRDDMDMFHDKAWLIRRVLAFHDVEIEYRSNDAQSAVTVSFTSVYMKSHDSSTSQFYTVPVAEDKLFVTLCGMGAIIKRDAYASLMAGHCTPTHRLAPGYVSHFEVGDHWFKITVVPEENNEKGVYKLHTSNAPTVNYYVLQDDIDEVAASSEVRGEILASERHGKTQTSDTVTSCFYAPNSCSDHLAAQTQSPWASSLVGKYLVRGVVRTNESVGSTHELYFADGFALTVKMNYTTMTLIGSDGVVETHLSQTRYAVFLRQWNEPLQHLLISKRGDSSAFSPIREESYILMGNMFIQTNPIWVWIHFPTSYEDRVSTFLHEHGFTTR